MFRILLIEDNPGDARLIEEMLKEAGVVFELECMDRLSAGIGEIKADGFDVILLDLGLPDSQGLATLTKLNEIKPDAPVIVLTGLADEATGMQAIKEGAQDYLIKGQVDKNLLSRSINYAVERKKAEEALEKSEERYRTLVEQSPDMIGVLVDGRLAYLNPAGLRLFGATRLEQMLHKSITDYIHPEDLNRIRERVRLAAEEALPNPLTELRILRLDGTVTHIEGVSIPLVYKGQTAVQFICRDITERKKTEEFIRNILESIDESFIVIDKDYKILSANKAYLSSVNKPAEEVVGRHCYELSHNIYKPCCEMGLGDCPVNLAFKTGEHHETVHTHHDKEGNPTYVETKAYPQKDSSGEVVSVIEIIINITEKKRLEDQLRQSQKMEAVGQIAGGIAHDFNNILTAIIGYASLLQMKMKEDDPLKVYIEPIITSTERAANLTQGLLAFSRKQISNPAPVNMNELIKKVEKFLQRVIGEDIELQAILSDKDITVMADSGQIEQVLVNLATNARDAMPTGGLLTIENGTVEIDAEYIKAHGYGKAGMYALISVTDSGIGMDEKTRGRIFEPFFTTKEVGKGTGLGLSIVYGIVKQHNGYVNCYSEPGKGTTFRIYLPLVQTALNEAKPVEVIGPAGGTETILLAEDEENVRDITRLVLEEYGYRVIEAIDGEDAVNKFMENKDKIVLLLFDVIMPKMSGKEAFDRIRKIRPDIKVLFASGYPADFIHRKKIDEQGLPFVVKPISPTALIKKVREVLDK